MIFFLRHKQHPRPCESLLLILCFLCFAISCEGQNQNQILSRRPLPPYSREIAKIGPYVLKEDFLRFRLSLELDGPTPFFQDEKGKGFEQNDFVKDSLNRILEKLIEDYLILAYGEKHNFVISEEELQIQFEKKKAFFDQKEFETLLHDKNIPYRRWKELQENEIRLQYILEKAFSKDIIVSPEDIRNYYFSNRKEFEVPERVRVRHIVTDSQEKAVDLLKRLERGENFAKLAVNHSLSPDRRYGGDLGYFSRGTFPKEFDEICFLLEKGEISPIVRSDYGYHIFKLIDKKPLGIKPLSQVMASLYRELFQKKVREEYDQLMKKAKQEISVEIQEENLRNFVL